MLGVVDDLALLLDSYLLALRAERKSPATLTSYGKGIRSFLKWCEENDRPALLDRATVIAFTAGLLDDGLDANTVKSRQGAVRRFSAWLAAEGEIESDQLIGIRPPKLDQRIIEPFTDTEIKALLKACATGDTFLARRDEALVRVMVECGLRAGEAISMTVDDVDLMAGSAVIRRGKGGRGRVVPFGPQTVRAIDRYMRARRTHKLASAPPVWLGGQSKNFGYDALYLALGARAKAAGLEGFHPHRLRHTAAHRWLAAGGSEGGLQAIAGWSSPAMLTRYTRARASDRAADEARKLNLGDL
jgi:integrase/recombinase XerD